MSANSSSTRSHLTIAVTPRMVDRAPPTTPFL